MEEGIGSSSKQEQDDISFYSFFSRISSHRLGNLDIPRVLQGYIHILRQDSLYSCPFDISRVNVFHFAFSKSLSSYSAPE